MQKRYTLLPGNKQGLLEAIRRAANEDDELLESFLKDLWTPAEWEDAIRRWRTISYLQVGASQRTATKLGHTSLATANRLSQLLKKKNGGFSRVLTLSFPR